MRARTRKRAVVVWGRRDESSNIEIGEKMFSGKQARRYVPVASAWTNKPISVQKQKQLDRRNVHSLTTTHQRMNLSSVHRNNKSTCNTKLYMNTFPPDRHGEKYLPSVHQSSPISHPIRPIARITVGSSGRKKLKTTAPPLLSTGGSMLIRGCAAQL